MARRSSGPLGTLLPLVLGLLATLRVDGFAEWMTKDFCRRSMAVGEVIMNAEVTASTDRSVLVYRGDQQLQSGDFYVPGELLTVKISDTKPQYVLEVSGPATAQLTGGGCDGTRLANKAAAELALPTGADAFENVTLHVAWASSHSTVFVSPDFVLAPKVVLPSAGDRSPIERVAEPLPPAGGGQPVPRAGPPAKAPSASILTSAANVSLSQLQQRLTTSLADLRSRLPANTSAATSSVLSSLQRLPHAANASSFVSRTGKLLTALELAALEELATASAETASRLRGRDDRVALQLAAREKQQAQQRQRAQAKSSKKLRGAPAKTPPSLDLTSVAHRQRRAPAAAEAAAAAADTTTDPDAAPHVATAVPADASPVDAAQRKRDAVRALQRQRREAAEDARAAEAVETEEDEEDEEQPDAEDAEDAEEFASSRRSRAQAQRRRRRGAASSSSSHPVLRTLVRMLLVLGLLFAGTVCCGSACVCWHSRFAFWRALKRRVGLATADDKYT